MPHLNPTLPDIDDDDNCASVIDLFEAAGIPLVTPASQPSKLRAPRTQAPKTKRGSNGQKFEKETKRFLLSAGFVATDPKIHDDDTLLASAVALHGKFLLMQNVPFGFDKHRHTEFAVYISQCTRGHLWFPDIHGNLSIRIECKSQEERGTSHEKIHAVLNNHQAYPEKNIVVVCNGDILIERIPEYRDALAKIARGNEPKNILIMSYADFQTAMTELVSLN